MVLLGPKNEVKHTEILFQDFLILLTTAIRFSHFCCASIMRQLSRIDADYSGEK